MAQTLDPNEMTDRQKWAIGALSERFYQVGKLKIISGERDSDMAAFLGANGYQSQEIAPVVGHMNAFAEIIRNSSLQQRQELGEIIEVTIASGMHSPPPPAP